MVIWLLFLSTTISPNNFTIMIKRTLFLVCLSVATSVINAQKDIVYFENDSYELSAYTRLQLDSLTRTIIADKHTDELLITGHTDIDGTEEYNKTLSSNRAKAVHDYLSNKGLNNRVRIVSYGEKVTVNANRNDEEKSFNRRVEIERQQQKLEDVFSSFSEPVQEFYIHPMRDTVLHCAKGTTIWIDGNSFQMPDYKSTVKFCVKEYYQKPEFVLANLVTKTTNNELLESGGMLHIEATQGDKVLELKPDNEIRILFTDRKENDNAEIFTGQVVNGEVVWVLQDINMVTEKREYVETPRRIILNEWSERTTKSVSRRAIKRSDKEGYSLIYDSASFVTTDPGYYENNGLMNNLIMSSNKLGWINCDSFINSKAPKTDVIVECAGDMKPKVCMIFKDRNSVLSYSFSVDNQYVFQNIPSGMEVELIGLCKDTQSGAIFFARQPFIIGQGESVALDFKKTDFDDIKAELETL